VQALWASFPKRRKRGEEVSVAGWVSFSECSRSVKAPCGAFVTLTKWGRLRGCMGMMMSEQPLLSTVREMAVAAAIDDPGFPGSR